MDKTLSFRVKELCSERSMTLKQLAEKMGIKPESLSRALNGNPHLSTLTNIAKALNVEVADLLTGGSANESKSREFLAVVIDHGYSYIFNHKSDLMHWVKGVLD